MEKKYEEEASKQANIPKHDEGKKECASPREKWDGGNPGDYEFESEKGGNGKPGGKLNGQGFDDYLNELGRADLRIAINDQIEAARTQLNSLNSNFNQQILDDNVKMLQTYDELQKVVVMIKLDMRQAFSVNLDYQDGDGDG